MTLLVLVLALAIDCHATLLVGRWQVGEPVSVERLTEAERPRTRATGPTWTGCRIAWPGPWQPGLLSWCEFLGPERCTLRIEPERTP